MPSRRLRSAALMKHLNPSTDAQRDTLLQQTPCTPLMCARISTGSHCHHQTRCLQSYGQQHAQIEAGHHQEMLCTRLERRLAVQCFYFCKPGMVRHIATARRLSRYKSRPPTWENSSLYPHDRQWGRCLQRWLDDQRGTSSALEGPARPQSWMSCRCWPSQGVCRPG